MIKLFENFDQTLVGDYIASEDFDMQGMFGKHKIKKGEKISVAESKLPMMCLVTLPNGTRTAAPEKSIKDGPLEKQK